MARKKLFWLCFLIGIIFMLILIKKTPKQTRVKLPVGRGIVGQGGYYHPDPNVALFQAMGFDDLNAVKVLLSSGADPNSFDRYNTPAIIFAAVRRGQSAKIVAELLKAGADPNIKDLHFKHTPLSEAIRVGDLEVVKELLDNGADANLKSKHGGVVGGAPFMNTPLCNATRGQYNQNDDEESQRIRKQMIFLLIRYGAKDDGSSYDCKNLDNHPMVLEAHKVGTNAH